MRLSCSRRRERGRGRGPGREHGARAVARARAARVEVVAAAPLEAAVSSVGVVPVVDVVSPGYVPDVSPGYWPAPPPWPSHAAYAAPAPDSARTDVTATVTSLRDTCCMGTSWGMWALQAKRSRARSHPLDAPRARMFVPTSRCRAAAAVRALADGRLRQLAHEPACAPPAPGRRCRELRRADAPTALARVAAARQLRPARASRGRGSALRRARGAARGRWWGASSCRVRLASCGCS